MVRIGATALVMALAGVLTLPAADANAQAAQQSVIRLAQAAPPDAPPPRRARRPTTRLRVTPRLDYWPEGVYPRYNPGPNAVRECTATYVQEYRPSGTVIVPRMSCHWRPG